MLQRGANIYGLTVLALTRCHGNTGDRSKPAIRPSMNIYLYIALMY